MIKKIVTGVFLCSLYGGLLWGMGTKATSHVHVKNFDKVESPVADDERIVDIDSFPALCSDVMLQLIAQPEFFDDSNALRQEMYKELPFKSLIIGQIFAILNDNLNHPLEVYVDDETENESGPCLLLFRLPRVWEQPVDYGHLTECYQKIIETLKNGWKYVSSTHTGSFFDRRSIFPQREWVAFVKEKKLRYEAALIMNLVKTFGLQDPVRVSDAEMWDVEPKGKVFLWIRSDTFDTFNRIFKFFYQLPSA